MQPPTVGFISGYKDSKLYYSAYQDYANRARIIFLHGAGEYSGKYEHFAEWLFKRNVDVYLMDLRGHGRSSGQRCHVDDFAEYAHDLDIFIKFIEGHDGKKDTFLVSHSLGALIAFFYVINFYHSFKGLIVSSPCLGLRLKIEPVKAWLVRALYPIIKNIPFASHIKPQIVTHDKYFIEKFEKDRFIHHTVTPNFYIQMIKATQYVKSHAHDLKVPILILQAGDDKICDRSTAENFYKTIAFSDKEFKLYDGFYHEILNEVDRERVFLDIHNWIKARVK